MRIGFVGPSYSTAAAISHEECINLYAEPNEATGAVSGTHEFGGQSASSPLSYYVTPGLGVFTTLAEIPVRGQQRINDRYFAVGGTQLVEIASDGTKTVRGVIDSDSLLVSIAVSSIQMLIVGAEKAYCYTLATNSLVEVTSSLAGTPSQVWYSDGYFIVSLANSNKFQMSQILDGITWPGIQVNQVSVFPENITSIIVNHRELWVFGGRHAQPYQDTGSNEVFDVIPGTLIEKGCGAAFSPCLLDNSVFWIDEDERGGRTAWRSNGYTPQRVSTFAVEADLATYDSISGMASYSYQQNGHLFWVLYVPGSQWSWVYDVSVGQWHKRAIWVNNAWQAHWSWNYEYAFGKHLLGDWNSGNIYEIDSSFLDDAGTVHRWLRRSPTVIDEMNWIYHENLTLDVQTGTGPTVPLTDGDGNPRQPQIMLRWSDNRGLTWSNEHWTDTGYAGQYNARVVWRRLGRSRYRIYEASGTDPVPWVIVDAYLEAGT